VKFFTKFKNFQRESPETPPVSMGEASLTQAAEHPLEGPADQSLPQKAEQEEQPQIMTELRETKRVMDVSIPEFTLNMLLARMIELGASDLHLESGSPPIYRIKGDIVFTNIEPLSKETTERLLFGSISETQKKTFLEIGNIDYSYELKDQGRFRVNYLKHTKGPGGVFRLIPSKIPTIDELGFPEVIKTIALSRRGIVLVTGPTGSGKTTTMAAMINHINQSRKGHIITIEDPVEFTHHSIKCLITHREVGHHTRSFADALKAALREDPDIILVGELRDLETIALALTAAQMGVFVMGTLHTNSAAKTIDRLIDVFPAKQQDQVRLQLSQSLRAIIAQQLMKTADEKGRIAALEILISNIGLSNIIREGKTTQIPSFILMGKSEGMQSMDNILASLAKSGKIKKEDAIIRAVDLSVMKRAGLLP
jgi:twitching motility protein PilT